ncbi:hypothetical protein LT493_11985 [Streptomyces tricolor]|nr:hypothetical protein [Streptomyces tricolor]
MQKWSGLTRLVGGVHPGFGPALCTYRDAIRDRAGHDLDGTRLPDPDEELPARYPSPSSTTSCSRTPTGSGSLGAGVPPPGFTSNGIIRATS